MKKEKRIWTKDDIINYINTSDQGLINGLLLLYECQTADEQKIEHTKYINGVGFNSPDSKKLSSMAKQYLAKQWLSQKQINFIRKRLVKYANQLTNIANSK